MWTLDSTCHVTRETVKEIDDPKIGTWEISGLNINRIWLMSLMFTYLHLHFL